MNLIGKLQEVGDCIFTLVGPRRVGGDSLGGNVVVHDALAGVANLPHSVGRFGDHQRTQVVGEPGIGDLRRPVFAGFFTDRGD